MAAPQKALKRGGRFCVCGSPGGVSCKNTTHTLGIIMHKFPSGKTRVEERRLWTKFVRRHHPNFSPTPCTICKLLENPMATGSEDMQIDNNLVMDVEEFNPVNTDNVGEQENGAISLNDIEENPQLLDVRSCLYESRDRTGRLPGWDVFHPVFIWE